MTVTSPPASSSLCSTSRPNSNFGHRSTTSTFVCLPSCIQDRSVLVLSPELAGCRGIQSLDDARRNAGRHDVARNAARNHGVGGDHAMLAQLHTLEDRHLVAHPDLIADLHRRGDDVAVFVGA